MLLNILVFSILNQRFKLGSHIVREITVSSVVKDIQNKESSRLIANEEQKTPTLFRIYHHT